MQGQQPKCCPAGSWPALQVEYQPKGVMTNNNLYQVGAGSKALVIIEDIFGIHSGRHRAVADTYAALGYNVYLPELLSNVYNGPFEMGPIVANIKSQSFQLIRSKFQTLVHNLQIQGIQQFYVVGFCWGVWAAFKLAKEFHQIISIAGMHPSLGVQKMFAGNQVNLAKQIKCPAFLYPAGNDPADVKNGGEVILALTAKFNEEVVGALQFPDMTHGWVVRGNLKDEKVLRDVAAAIKHSHEYFNRFLKGVQKL